MLLDRPVVLDTLERQSRRHVDPHAYRALMQIGLARRHSRRETDHGHDRESAEHDNPYVRHAEVADLVEDRVETDAVLDHDLVGMPTEAVLTVQGIGEMVGQVVFGQEQPCAGPEATVLVIVDNEDTVTA